MKKEMDHYLYHFNEGVERLSFSKYSPIVYVQHSPRSNIEFTPGDSKQILKY